jgi:outer membrane protein
MKKTLIVSSLVAAFALAVGSPAQADMKIGFVDMNKIFAGYYKTKDAETRINEGQSVASKELQDLVDLYKKNAEVINKLSEELKKPELSKETKEKKEKERDEKFNEYKGQEKEIADFRTRKQKELQEQAVRMRNGIVEDITKLINEKVKSEQFDLVIDKSGNSLNGVPIVLYSKDTNDFSDEIIKALNANKLKDAATPAASESKTESKKK